MKISFALFAGGAVALTFLSSCVGPYGGTYGGVVGMHDETVSYRAPRPVFYDNVYQPAPVVVHRQVVHSGWGGGGWNGGWGGGGWGGAHCAPPPPVCW